MLKHLFAHVQAYVVEDNKQLILEGQLHVTLQTVGKEAFSLPQKEVRTVRTNTNRHKAFVPDLDFMVS